MSKLLVNLLIDSHTVGECSLLSPDNSRAFSSVDMSILLFEVRKLSERISTTHTHNVAWSATSNGRNVQFQLDTYYVNLLLKDVEIM